MFVQAILNRNFQVLAYLERFEKMLVLR